MGDTTDPEPECRPRCAGRRAVLAATGAAVLSGCQVYEESAPPPAPVASGASAGPRPVARLDEIPVGGGRILAAERVVLSRPESGRVRAFSTVCTHQGCAVDQLAGGTLTCPCHGSKFAVADGSVVSGPARRPLPELPVTVAGDTILLP
ncbi:Rieske (2Fe-2S) protein [Actinoplanes sp. NPDC049599]|uniref:Rieske (2Fe-2S) protein n=1 Tax=Actinoplanes sp. NPDC049599 TaxID=3363903 RepID=UPI0037A1CAC8